ncbi:MAG TPA: GDP-mannose 4,6-dehydratase [Phycisphaerae bacterium]|nr:GDP-mannose 4,6-dehydratase [Phycisphaerae bacterium]HRW52743.1 GDP-mannose 4,6-dehydratase [Phycisphaerae bacterium]
MSGAGGSTILVTGGAGFIGSHLCEALLARGDRVIAYDSFDPFYDVAIKRRNIEAASQNPSYRLIEADIRDLSAAEAALADVDCVVHLAARAGVRPSIEQPLVYQDVNLGGLNVMLEAARSRGVKKFVFASSSSVYGNNRKVPFSEDDPVDHPISPYAATKKAGELICHTYHHLFGMDITCLRFFTVYGARQRPDLAIHKFTRLIDAGQPIPVFGDGSMMRDHTYIDDIIRGVVASIDNTGGFRVYNLGESRPVSLSDLIAAIEAALGKKAVIDRKPVPPGDVQTTYADVTRAQVELAYEPRTHLADGLAMFVEWFRAGRSSRSTTP